MKLSLNESKLTELWASSSATYSTVLDFKIRLLARKVFCPLEKRAADTIQGEWIASLEEI